MMGWWSNCRNYNVMMTKLTEQLQELQCDDDRAGGAVVGTIM